MMFFPKIKEYVTEYSGYNRQVVYYVLFSNFYLPQKDKTSQQDKSFTVQTLVTCSNQCLHLFHTASEAPSLAHLWQSMPCQHQVFYFIRTVFIVLVFLSCVYICFDMPCTHCEWISILVYIYLKGSPSSSGEGVCYRWSPCPVVVMAPPARNTHYMQSPPPRYQFLNI